MSVISQRTKSIGIVSIFMLSLFVAMATTIPPVSAINETSSGSITNTETWMGVHNLDGDLVIEGGAKLIINAGTTINIPYDRNIHIEGSICAGDSSCGATQASTGSPIRFIWGDAPTGNLTSRCYVTGLWNPDLSCGSGIYIDSTIDQASTRMNHIVIDGAYGIPVDISGAGNVKYGALIFDGASLTVTNPSFTDINTTNVLAFNGASPTLTGGTFSVGVDGNDFQGAAIQAYGAGAGLVVMQILNSAFTGVDTDCGSQGGGRSAIYLEDSFVRMDTISISQNSYGAFLRSSSGYLTNSTLDTKCNAIDTNSHLATGLTKYTFYIEDNQITTAEGAGITAYDQAIVVANRNTISGAAEGSGFGIRSSYVTANNNIIGPIGGWNGFWIYGEADVSAENNTIMDTGKEPVLIGEYHHKDQGWNVPSPSKARLYFANNVISNNTGTCTSQYMYGGDFPCPAFHVYMSSATFIDNTVRNSIGDGFRIKGGIVNAQGNDIEMGGTFAARVSHYDDNYGTKYGSIAYFRDNTYSNASQIYNVTESRVSIQSEYVPDPGGNVTYPVQLAWLGAECDVDIEECLTVPMTADWPPRDMPLSMELKENATTFTFADVTNFDRSKIYIQNQNTAWGVQVEQAELVKYQVKADNSQVADAYVKIKDSAGRSLYNLTTDAYGNTPWISLPSNFHIDTNWNHVAIDAGEDSCGDYIDNDGDTLKDGNDPDCQSGGREMPSYSVEASKFGKGVSEHDFELSGMVDEVIHLSNLPPSVSVSQEDSTSFARIVKLTGSAHDGLPGPYFSDYDSISSQFGNIREVEIQPHGSQDWYRATDTSGANGEVSMTNWPFKTWSFDWDMTNHFEDDVTFRVRSSDGLDESTVITRVFKLNINPPTINLETPIEGSTHDGQEVMFSGTASDDYQGVQGSDIKDIWFSVVGPNNYSANYAAENGGSTSWADSWNFSALPSGDYTFTVWASDSNYCTNSIDICTPDTVTITIDNDNRIPIVQISDPLPMETVRADEETLISGVARDNDGQVTRLEISVFDLASGIELNNGPDPITSFASNGAWATYWDTSDLIHDQQYELRVKAYDGIDYSNTETVRVIIDNPTAADNIAPVFTNSENWPSTLTIFCDEKSSSFDRCGDGAEIDLLSFFEDEDGIGPASQHFTWNTYDDPMTALDDDHFAHILISPDGVLTYNPMNSMYLTSSEISDWSLTNVMIEARDIHSSAAYSYQISFIVKGVTFTAQRADTGTVLFEDSAEFMGTGLPFSQVTAKKVKGEIYLNTTTVKSDGTWMMEITSSQLGDDGSYGIFFEQSDSQTIGFDDGVEISLTTGEEESEGIATWLMIVLVIVALIVLAGVGAYFFVEFEEIDEEAENLESTAEVEDPYAWAKDRMAETAQAAPAPAPAPVPVSQPQHPGWIWDMNANEWKPDPNYQPSPQVVQNITYNITDSAVSGDIGSTKDNQ